MTSLVRGGSRFDRDAPTLPCPLLTTSTSNTSEHDYGRKSNQRSGVNSAKTAAPTVTPSTTAGGEQPMYTCMLNSSFTASTQFVSSLTTQNLDDVEHVLADYPEAIADNVAVEKQELSPSKPHVVTQVVVIHPEDDEEAVVDSAIRNITESLNRSAAEKIARGESPPCETVIEIVRVKQPSASTGHLSRESNANNKQVFIHSPGKGGTLEEQALYSQRLLSPVEERGRVATPSPPRYSAMVRRKPDMSATCYFDTQQSAARQVQRSVSYTVTKTPAQSVPKMTPQNIPRKTVGGTFQGQRQTQAFAAHHIPAINQVQLLPVDTVNEQYEQSLIIDDGASEVYDGEDSSMMERMSSSCSSGYGSGLGYYDDGGSIHRRPAYSYMHLIQMAICSKSNRRMTLREIYQWIEDQFPYYRHQTNKGWKNSIRHNLSLYDIFVREKNKSPNHTGSSYWTVRLNGKQKHGLRGVRLADGSLSSSQVNLLPKPPAAPATGFAIIPIQSGALSTRQLVVQPLADASMTISGDAGFSDKRPRILKRAIRTASPDFAKQPRIIAKPSAGATSLLNNSEIRYRNIQPAATVRSSYPTIAPRPPANRQRDARENGRFLSHSLDAGMLDSSSLTSNDDSLCAQLDTSELRQRMSLMNVRSTSVDLANENVLSANTKLDCLATVAAEMSEEPDRGLPKPRIGRSRKSKLMPRNCDLEEENQLAISPAVTPKKRGAVSRIENGHDADDIPEFFSSLGDDLSGTPLKMLLNTPPRAGGADGCFLSSTPISGLGDLVSPLSASLLCGLTPLSAKFSPRSYLNNIDSGVFGSGGGSGHTPFRIGEQSPPPYTRLRERFPSGSGEFAIDSSPHVKRPTPLRFLSSPGSFLSTGSGAAGLSPGLGSLRRLGLHGLTPRRSRPNSETSVVSPNEKNTSIVEPRAFSKLFEGIPMDDEDTSDGYLEFSFR